MSGSLLREFVRRILEENETRWAPPDIGEERDEIERSAQDLSVPLDDLIDAIGAAKLGPLSTSEWSSMRNTDSWETDDESKARALADEYERDIDRLFDALDSGKQLPAPIVIFPKGHDPYLVGGNTRLMAARARGLTPQVLRVMM